MEAYCIEPEMSKIEQRPRESQQASKDTDDLKTVKERLMLHLEEQGLAKNVREVLVLLLEKQDDNSQLPHLSAEEFASLTASHGKDIITAALRTYILIGKPPLPVPP